ncbi:hypothetical protein Ct9H90mP29_17100 [bacterium]|nr:MAG: hypothetical protein Ct9H90mP29_17100 [bacterium]
MQSTNEGVILGLINMFKHFITYTLSILFLSATLHVDHHHEHHDGYSICDVNCDNESHDSLSHQCEKCLKENNRLIVQETIDLSFNEGSLLLLSSDESFNHSLSIFYYIAVHHL